MNDTINRHLQNALCESLNYAADHGRENGYKPFVTMLYGSQNYGLSTSASDYDTKVMMLPTIETLVLKSHLWSKDIQTSWGLVNAKDYRAMLSNFFKGNINFVECLYTDGYKLYDEANPKVKKLFNELRDKRDWFSNSSPVRLAHMVLGMAKQKHKGMLKETPRNKTDIQRYGYEPKQLFHLVRLTYFLNDYLKHLDFSAALCPSNREYLLSIKDGYFPYDKALEEANDQLSKLEGYVQYAERLFNLGTESHKRREQENFNVLQEFMDDWTMKVFKELIQ